MAFLKEKAEFNFEAANVLFQENLYAPSVHCAYYSCFQLMKHILNSKLNIPYKTQSDEIATSKIGSHVYIKKHIFKEIEKIERLNKEQYTNINRKLSDLKLYRETADYKNEQVDSEFCDRAINNAKELRYYFKNKLL